MIPAFNAATYLYDTLQSVPDQQYGAPVCCFVNDGSTDETAPIAERFCATDSRFRKQPEIGDVGLRP
jgi:glycosyltransferase involved in cell wall biosynthesis